MGTLVDFAATAKKLAKTETRESLATLDQMLDVFLLNLEKADGRGADSFPLFRQYASSIYRLKTALRQLLSATMTSARIESRIVDARNDLTVAISDMAESATKFERVMEPLAKLMSPDLFAKFKVR